MSWKNTLWPILTQLSLSFGITKPGLPDFSWCMIQGLEKCTKSTQNVPNGHKIVQMTVKYS
jgi:hypothetical protein